MNPPCFYCLNEMKDLNEEDIHASWHVFECPICPTKIRLFHSNTLEYEYKILYFNYGGNWCLRQDLITGLSHLMIITSNISLFPDYFLTNHSSQEILEYMSFHFLFQ